ncbi:MAG: ATP-binding protein [Anaerolineae bacterium]|nr:ATP-binding protein [Anaerolineae bacterium]
MPDSNSNLSFLHLQLELARLDILLHRQIQRFHQATLPVAEDVDNGRFFMSTNQALALLQRPFGSSYDELNEEEDTPYEEALTDIQQQIAAVVEQADAQQISLRLFQLAVLLDLDRIMLDTFLISIAPQLDPRYGKLYGFLQDDLTRKRPSVNLVLDLLFVNSPERLLALTLFGEESPLLLHRLVTLEAEPGIHRPPLVEKSLYPDEGIVNWLLLGLYQAPQFLKECLSFNPKPAPNLNLLATDMQTQLETLRSNDGFFNLYGRDKLAQQEAATRIAQFTQSPLLTLDLEKAITAAIPAKEAVHVLLRDALLINALPAITGWDVCLTDDAPPPELLKAVHDHPGSVVIISEKKWQARSVPRTRHFYWLEFSLPLTHQRTHLLTHFLEAETAVPPLDIDLLAGQFKLSTEQLQDLVSTARDLAAQNGRSVENQDLFAAARAHSNPKLATLAKKITPRYSWEDLVLPADQVEMLREMVQTVRCRPQVLEEWGIGKKLTASAGVTALFFGEPGTGKTMGAEVMAGELGLDLYKIDLSTMVSKYIGETEKNLEKIFNEAESSNAILFFDEADAIFGKRSEVKDAHDRYANIEISYLLQRMETYDGVTILATNLRNNLDDAFMRRLQFALDFPFPKAPDRLHIWQTLFPSTVPRDPDLDFELMAERFEIPGGNIRNIIVTATYLAASNGQVVTMAHLMHGTRRELQKMGRLVDDRELEI